MTDVSANVVAASLFDSCDENGNEFRMLKEVIDHRSDDTAVPKGDGWIRQWLAILNAESMIEDLDSGGGDKICQHRLSAERCAEQALGIRVDRREINAITRKN